MQITEIKPRKKKDVLKRVAAYARVSVDKEGLMHSLAAQIEYYTNYIDDNPNWINVGIYADEGITGTKVNRPEFQKLLKACRAGKVDMIIVKSISRFSRNTVDLLKIIRELKSRKVDVYFEEQNIHSASGEGELMLTILASYAEEESRSVSENCHWRYKKAFERGEVINIGEIYGYGQKNGKIWVDEKEAEIVRWIFDSYLSGMGVRTIMRTLNEKGIRTKTGKEWHNPVIYEMLANEKYTGNALLQKTYTPDFLTKKEYKNNGEWPQYYAEDTHPAIISMETFQAAQKKLEINRKRAGRVRDVPCERHDLEKMIRCPKCGNYYNRKKSKYEVAWVCATYLKKGRAACQSKKIPEDIIKKEIEEIEKSGNKVIQIEANDQNLLVFEMQDGSKIERKWKDKSRADSWTDEMRKKASERSRAICQAK